MLTDCRLIRDRRWSGRRKNEPQRARGMTSKLSGQGSPFLASLLDFPRLWIKFQSYQIIKAARTAGLQKCDISESKREIKG